MMGGNVMMDIFEAATKEKGSLWFMDVSYKIDQRHKER